MPFLAVPGLMVRSQPVGPAYASCKYFACDSTRGSKAIMVFSVSTKGLPSCGATFAGRGMMFSSQDDGAPPVVCAMAQWLVASVVANSRARSLVLRIDENDYSWLLRFRLFLLGVTFGYIAGLRFLLTDEE